MSNFDFDRELEAIVREELRRSIVPPATPDYIRDCVDDIAAAATAAPRHHLIPLPGAGAMKVRALAAAVVIGALIVAGLCWHGAQPAPATGTPGFSPVSTSSPGTVLHLSLTPDGAGFVYIDGDGLRVTTDRGASWSEARQIPASDSAQDHIWDAGSLDFVDAQHGWMIGVTNGAQGSQVTVYRTGDGGRTWQPALITSLPPDGSPTADGSPALAGSFVAGQDHFRDALHGWVVIGRVVNSGVVDCQVYETGDGGLTWSGPTSSACIGLSPEVTWVTAALGYFVPPWAQNSVSVTQDGGQSWSTQGMPGTWARVMPELLEGDESGHLTIVATEAEWRGGQPPYEVLDSTDGGASWSKAYDMTVPNGFDEVSALGAEHWIATVDNANGCAPGGSLCSPYAARGLMETMDGGRTWSVASDSVPGAPYWWDTEHAVAVGDLQPCSDPNASSCVSDRTVFVTVDGGATWRPAFSAP
jgi:photosystem II stability/assembly factor-like uncharacterized protein